MSEPARLVSGPLQTERLSNGRRMLLRELVVEVEGTCITVPAATNTDYTSAPALVRPFIHWSRVDVAGVVHDYLYQTGGIARSEADRIWRLVAMSGEHRANTAQAWGGWLLLRLGGWLPWRRYRRDGNPWAAATLDGCPPEGE